MRKERKQSPVISILIVILGIMLGYFIDSQFSSDIDIEDVVQEKTSEKEFMFESFATLKFDLGSIEQKSYTDLKLNGPGIITPSRRGRVDIFAPL